MLTDEMKMGILAYVTGAAGFTMAEIDTFTGWILKVISIFAFAITIATTLGIIDKPFKRKKE